MLIQAIIFDFFGVVCSEVAPVWFQNNFPDKKHGELKDTYFEPVDSGKITEDELLNKLSSISHKPTAKINEELYELVSINHDVAEYITQLKSDYKIGLCSNSGSNFLHSILISHELTHLFDAVIVSSECGVTKPDERIYKYALEKLSVQAPETLFIDDNPNNVKGAERAGIHGLLFTDIQNLKQQVDSMVT